MAAAHLRHENIVPVYRVGEERGVHSFAMQFVEGRSLAHPIAEARRPTPVERLWKLARRHPSMVAAGLAMILLLVAGSLLSTFLIQAEQRSTEEAHQRAQEMVSQLKLTSEQRERIRTIEEESAFGWMKRQPGDSDNVCCPEGKSANERIVAVLTEEQRRRWREITGEPMKVPLTPLFAPSRFGSHGSKTSSR